MFRKIKILLALMAIVAGVFSVMHASSSAQTRAIDFKRDIEPIFQANCYGCHSAKKASAQLRLDSKTAAMKGGLSGAVIVAGRSGESRLVQRLLGEGGDPRMPLGSQPLSGEQIQLIRKWIDEGAVWPDDAALKSETPAAVHWAFKAPTKAQLPQVQNRAWTKTPVDYFILEKLEKLKLAPSPEADKEMLIRRLSLDITGLPPTIKEIDDFLADNSPGAYRKLVERLLASPHYGERWGRWWLDAARYADSNGFEKDLPRSIWPYRDWVISAFNGDMPFDRFTIEQLAGDLLPDPTLEQRIATGFLRNSMLNQEGGVDPEQFRVEGLIDRVDAVGKAFLGLTVNCAQCHNHKFDPIAQKEYYQFYAFLNSDDEPELEVPGDAIIAKRKDIQTKIARIEDDLIAGTPDLEKRLRDWEAGLQIDSSEWATVTDASIHASFGVKFDKLEDGSFIARGDNSTSNNYVITAKTGLKKITGFRLELLTDPNLPRTGPGRSNDGSFFVTEFVVEVSSPGQPDAKRKIQLKSAAADFERPDFPVKNVIDGEYKTHWSSDAGPGRRNQDRKIVLIPQTPVELADGAALIFQVAQKADETIDLRGGKPNIGKFRLSVTSSENPKGDNLPANVRRILSIPPGDRTKEQKREVFSFYRTTVKEWSESNSKTDDLMREWPYGPTSLALSRRPTQRETRIFKRGDWKRPGDLVTPGTPSVLHPFPADLPRNRLGLARWIVDSNNPLTARVIVNRIWQQYFGSGLVTTPEDFGARCEAPSHPELLDWLAKEFIESGWSIKHIHRLILESATYRQSSKITPSRIDADPTNRWLARFPRLRVDSEIIRDSALSAAGLLSGKIGGPSVYPPIPDGVLSLGYGSPMKWETATGEDRYRRAMYTFWKRSVPYPSLLVFDQPNGDFSCTRRIRSNTPLQALTTLNDQLFMEIAQGLAMRVWKEGGADDSSKLIYAFRLCTGRRPDAFELQKMRVLLNDQQAYFNGRTAAAVYVSSPDPNKLPEDVDLQKIAPWTIVARTLLNLDESITRQ